MGGHEVGGRLVVVRSWSRWEGVEGLQNVSAWESSCVWEVSSTVSTLSFSSRVRLRRRVEGEPSDTDSTRLFWGVLRILLLGDRGLLRGLARNNLVGVRLLLDRNERDDFL